jgi:hypothetical protein
VWCPGWFRPFEVPYNDTSGASFVIPMNGDKPFEKYLFETGAGTLLLRHVTDTTFRLDINGKEWLWDLQGHVTTYRGEYMHPDLTLPLCRLVPRDDAVWDATTLIGCNPFKHPMVYGRLPH